MARYISKEQHDAIRTAAAKYAWPGGYPTYLITADCAALCPTCVQQELRLILRGTHDSDRRGGWCAEAADINWEDPNLYCDHCGERIESAYAEDNHEAKPTE